MVHRSNGQGIVLWPVALPGRNPHPTCPISLAVNHSVNVTNDEIRLMVSAIQINGRVAQRTISLGRKP